MDCQPAAQNECRRHRFVVEIGKSARSAETSVSNRVPGSSGQQIVDISVASLLGHNADIADCSKARGDSRHYETNEIPAAVEGELPPCRLPLHLRRSSNVWRTRRSGQGAHARAACSGRGTQPTPAPRRPRKPVRRPRPARSTPGAPARPAAANRPPVPIGWSRGASEPCSNSQRPRRSGSVCHWGVCGGSSTTAWAGVVGSSLVRGSAAAVQPVGWLDLEALLEGTKALRMFTCPKHRPP